MTDVPTTRRPRRIVRRAVLAIVGVVLLVSGYVGSYFAAEWLAGHDAIPTGAPLSRVYAPLMLYERSDLPGSVEFFWLIREMRT